MNPREIQILLTEDEKEKQRERLRLVRNMVDGLSQARFKKTPKPKRDRNLLDKLPTNDKELERALFECFLMARRGKALTVDEWKFDVFWRRNLEVLKQKIIDRTWKPGTSKAFIIHDPVDREIFAAMFMDRTVHHLLYAIVAPWWDRRFIYDAYSCRRGKGTDFGAKRLQKFMLAASDCGKKEAFVLKGDLSGYFMSMRRDLLYEKVMWGLRRQFPDKGWTYNLAAYLWKEVIFDDPCRNARVVGSLRSWDCLPKNKSLFWQPEGRGIVIGNLTSQLLSNILLNSFDWFVKKKLGFRYYGRYVDDFFIVVKVEEFERAKYAMRKEIPRYLEAMGLKMHPKKIYIQPVSKGCPFLGKMVRPFVLMPGTRYLRNMRKALRGYVRGEVEYDSLQSYVGQGKNMAATKAMRKVLDEMELNNTV